MIIQRIDFFPVTTESLIDWSKLKIGKVDNRYAINGAFRILQEANNNWNVRMLNEFM